MHKNQVINDLDAAKLVEKAEAKYFARFQTSASDETRVELGIDAQAFGDGIAVSMRADRSKYWNKALGFGFDEPITEQLIADVVAYYQAAGSSTAVITAAPVVLPSEWERICSELGLSKVSNWAKLLCPTTDFRSRDTSQTVRELVEEDTDAWAELVRTAFGLVDPDLTPLLRAAILDDQARVFGAWDGEALMGAGAVYFFDDVASINTGATSAAYRNQGVQTALLSARAQAATEAGCIWLAAETGSPDADGNGNASFRNLTNAGFVHLYDRPNWRWDAPEN